MFSVIAREANGGHRWKHAEDDCEAILGARCTLCQSKQSLFIQTAKLVYKRITRTGLLGKKGTDDLRLDS